MSDLEPRDLQPMHSWEKLSPNLRQVIVLNNALPEKFPEIRGSENRRMATGVDAERETEIEGLEKGMDEPSRQLFKDYLKRKHDYFVGYVKRYYKLVSFFREQGMLGESSRNRETGKTWQAVARHSLVMSELSGNLAEGLEQHGQALNPEMIRLAGLVHDMEKRAEMEHLWVLQERNLKASPEESLSEDQVYKQVADVGESEFLRFMAKPEVRSELEQLLPEFKVGENFPNFVSAIKNIREVGSMETVQQKGLSANSLSLDEYQPLDNNLSRILFYLDQIIKHTAIVSIKERFADARKRYASPESQQSAHFIQMDNREKIALKLEQELVNILGIKPEEMQEYLSKLFFEKLYKN